MLYRAWWCIYVMLDRFYYRTLTRGSRRWLDLAGFLRAAWEVIGWRVSPPTDELEREWSATALEAMKYYGRYLMWGDLNDSSK